MNRVKIIASIAVVAVQFIFIQPTFASKAQTYKALRRHGFCDTIATRLSGIPDILKAIEISERAVNPANIALLPDTDVIVVYRGIKLASLEGYDANHNMFIESPQSDEGIAGAIDVSIDKIETLKYSGRGMNAYVITYEVPRSILSQGMHDYSYRIGSASLVKLGIRDLRDLTVSIERLREKDCGHLLKTRKVRGG